jgi:hypothetical protein
VLQDGGLRLWGGTSGIPDQKLWPEIGLPFLQSRTSSWGQDFQFCRLELPVRGETSSSLEAGLLAVWRVCVPALRCRLESPVTHASLSVGGASRPPLLVAVGMELQGFIPFTARVFA